MLKDKMRMHSASQCVGESCKRLVTQCAEKFMAYSEKLWALSTCLSSGRGVSSKSQTLPGPGGGQQGGKRRRKTSHTRLMTPRDRRISVLWELCQFLKMSFMVVAQTCLWIHNKLLQLDWHLPWWANGLSTPGHLPYFLRATGSW